MKTPLILSLNQIKESLPQINIFEKIKQGFIAYSKGEAVIPPVGELIFSDPPGDVHIKYGYIKSQPFYVVKIASGFYQNDKLGLSSSQGLNLLFDKKTGILISILLDEGYLTDIRTAVAGALASQCLANIDSQSIGVVGAGIQAQYQMQYHLQKFDVSDIYIWNRNIERSKELRQKLSDSDTNIKIVDDLEDLCRESQIIVTTTPSKKPLIKSEWIQPGTHITAIGSDTFEKVELDAEVLSKADLIVVDSLSQSESRGEVFQGIKAAKITRADVQELGSIFDNHGVGRTNPRQITIADLTGVAVEDLMISQAVYEAIIN